MPKQTKVCLLFGGQSTEQAISCRSAVTIWKALESAGYEVYPVGIDLNGNFHRYEGEQDALLEGEWSSPIETDSVPAHYLSSPKSFLSYHCGGITPDIIYPAVHGINSEDGVLQGFMEMTNLPYVGSGVLSSAVGMDKAFAKLVFAAVDIPQVPYYVAYRTAIEENLPEVIEEITSEMRFPLFLKPSNGGSSVGTRQVKTADALAKALEEVAHYDEKVLVESFIDAREIEVSVKGNWKPQAAQAGEVVKAQDVAYYDFETKYVKSGAHVEIPAKISSEIADEITKLALKAYRVLGCSGLSRVDFFLDEENHIYLNEINTLPGFTSISLYPMAWEKAGIDMPALVSDLCDLALDRYNKAGKKLEKD